MFRSIGKRAITTLGPLAVLVISAPAVYAQAPAGDFPDVPANHWAYQSVHDLASKGLVLGYPDGSFLGSRAMTRYEFATVIERIMQAIDQAKANPTLPPNLVTQDDLNKIQVLIDKFQPELDDIKANVTQAQQDIQALRTELDDLRQDVSDTKDLTAKAQATANSSYGAVPLRTLNVFGVPVANDAAPGRKFSISGLIESRVVMASTNSTTRFPVGHQSNGEFNGNFAQGNAADSAEVRRARIIMLGQPTPNTSYKIQMDIAGAVNATTANSQFNLLEAYGTYTFGDGSSKYPAISMGGFANPFGYILPASPAAWLTPERPLAFSEASNVGLWDKQDYDKGLRFVYGPGTIHFTYAMVNGAGRNSENTENHFDSIVRLAYQSPNKLLTIGGSYYDGLIDQDVTSAPPFSYAAPKKELAGADVEIQGQDGTFLSGEYVSGTYEKRAYFDSPTATSLSVDPYVPHNQVQGYYIWGGHTFNMTSARPLTLGVDYDVFDRSRSSLATGAVPASGLPDYASGSTFDDVNWGFGGMYNLDKATRMRLWYETPTSVAHAPGTAEPPHIGLYTAEMLFRF